MAPEVEQFNHLDFVAESFDTTTKDFLYTMFAIVERDDSVYFGQLPIPKLEITPKEFTAALVHLPDEEIYPEFPSGGELSAAPDQLASHHYLKRPRLFTYDEYKADDVVYIIPTLLLEEAHVLEIISKQPRPGIVGFHGCRVRRGFITGPVLDRHASDLKQYVRDRTGAIEKEPFMAALTSAARHIHSAASPITTLTLPIYWSTLVACRFLQISTHAHQWGKSWHIAGVRRAG